MSTLTLTSADQHHFEAYAVGDEQAEQGLIVLQEIFGVNQHIRNTCDRFAEQGYRVLSPALFDRQEKQNRPDHHRQTRQPTGDARPPALAGQ